MPPAATPPLATDAPAAGRASLDQTSKPDVFCEPEEHGPFAAAARKLSVMPEEQEYIPRPAAPAGEAQQQQQQQPGASRRRRGWCSCACLGGGAVKGEEGGAAGGDAAGGHGAASGAAAMRPLGSRLSGTLRSSMKRLSLRQSGAIRQLGSMAYSDVEWFDALSKIDSRDHASLMVDIDKMVEAASTGPFVPDPPLHFGKPGMRFLPFPLDVSHFCGIWAKDLDRTTPPPLPVDVMLKLGWMVQKVHNSVLHIQLKETDTEMVMVAKPGFAPPGMPCYTEYYAKLEPRECGWTLRRDLKAGRSAGRMFMAADGTLVYRVRARPMMSSTPDVICEEYLRLEDGGNTLVARQCCLHVPTGKEAVQYLVGHRCATPPKGWA